MRRIVIGVAAAAILGGGAYYGLFVVPSQQLRAGLDQAIASLPPGWTVKYGGANFSLLSHTAVITDLSIQGPSSFPVNQTIAKLTIEQPALDLVDQWNKAQANPSALKPDQALPVADRIAIEGVKMSGAANGTMAGTSLTKLRIYPWPLFRPGMPALKDIGDVFAASMRAQAQIAEEQKALAAPQQKSAESEIQGPPRPLPRTFRRCKSNPWRRCFRLFALRRWAFWRWVMTVPTAPGSISRLRRRQPAYRGLKGLFTSR